MMRWATSLLIAFVMLCGTAASADFQAGQNAYERGDYVGAMKQWRPLAESGNTEAQFYVGTLYYHGEGVPQNNAEAASWYRRAADQGHVLAQHNLGVMYHEGQGVPRDRAEALRWFHRAAEQGHAAAQYNLGIMYAEGDGTPQDNVQAYHWFSHAADQGEQNARQATAFVANRLTPAQRAEAERLAREWRPKAERNETGGKER